MHSKILIATIFCAFSAEALKCYTCDFSDAHTCQDKSEKLCAAEEDHCVTLTGTAGGDAKMLKSCVAYKEESDVKQQCATLLAGVPDGPDMPDLECKFCKEELCNHQSNSAGIFKFSAGLLLAVALVAVAEF